MAAERQPDSVTVPVLQPPPQQVGEYDILGEVGRGGMGVVYKARHRSLHRLAALKMVLAGEFASATQQLRLRLEAELAARVQHPNIVQLYEIGTHEGRPFLAMEWVEGGSLADRLDGKPWPPGEAAALVQTLARAIHVAHGEGVVHRDLKPANILFAAGGGGSRVEGGKHKREQDGDTEALSTHQPPPSIPYPKIADFGLAQPADSAPTLTQSGFLVGTPSYMAPEQASGRRALVGPATDIYALGVVLYQLLTGQLPFQGDSALEVLRAVVSDEPVRPRRLQPRLPRDLETICLKCLAKEPGRRYADAQELAEDLRRFLDREPIAARRVGWPERLALWVRRRPTQAVVYGLAALVLVLAGLGGGAVTLWQQSESAKEDVERARAAERKAKDDLDRALDRHRVLFAHAAWRDNAVGRAEQLLLECAPERRGWEWRYVYRLCHTELATLRGHGHHVTSVAFSPDGSRLLTASWDGMAKVWDAATGKAEFDTPKTQQTANLFPTTHVGRVVLTLKWNAVPVTAAAFSPDGTRVAVGSYDGTAKVWDTATGKEVLAPKGHRLWVSAVAYSPDGRRLATASFDGTAKVWDAATGEEIRTLQGRPEEIQDLDFSPDGTRVAAAYRSSAVQVWDAATGKEVLTLRGHADWVLAVRFSPDGTRLATASLDGTAKVWDAATGKEIRTLEGHAGKVFGVAFSPDGRRLATAHDNGTAKVWDAATGQEALAIRGHTLFVRSVAFSPDGKHLATASNDKTAKVWDTAVDQECLTLKGPSAPFLSVAFSPDGTRVAAASRDGTTKVWDAAAGKEIHILRGPYGRVAGVAFSPDGRRLATAHQDGTARVWDAATGKDVLVRKHAGEVLGVAFSSDGSRLATASSDGTAKVWDAATGEEMLTLNRHAGPAWSVAFSPDDSRLATASDDGTAKVWNAVTGQAARTFKGPGALRRIVFSPDGTRLAAACVSEGTPAQLWDAATGREILTLKGHTIYTEAVAFSSDGKRLATASFDGAKVWDAATGQETLTLKGHTAGLSSVVFSPDGRRLATASLDGTVRIWDAPHLPPPGKSRE
jgi:WD40 repeat protein